MREQRAGQANYDQRFQEGCLVKKGQRMTEDKGVEEFVGGQEDYGGNSRFEWDPVSSSGDVLPGCCSSTKALPELWARVSLSGEAQTELTDLKKKLP